MNKTCVLFISTTCDFDYFVPLLGTMAACRPAILIANRLWVSALGIAVG